MLDVINIINFEVDKEKTFFPTCNNIRIRLSTKLTYICTSLPPGSVQEWPSLELQRGAQAVLFASGEAGDRGPQLREPCRRQTVR